MAIKSNKKNPIAKNLFTKKYKLKIVKPKKGKGSFKRKKFKFKVLRQFVVLLLDDISVPFSKLSFIDNLLIYPCKNPAANRSPAPVRSIILRFFCISLSTTSSPLTATAPFSPLVTTTNLFKLF